MDFQQYHFHITGYENDTPATIQSKSPRAYLIFVKVRFSINIRRETNRTVTVRSPYDHRLGQMTVTVRFVSLWMFYANAKLFRKNIHPRKLSATFRRRRPRMAGITLNYSPDTEFGSACGVLRSQRERMRTHPTMQGLPNRCTPRGLVRTACTFPKTMMYRQHIHMDEHSQTMQGGQVVSHTREGLHRRGGFTSTES